MFGSFGSLFRVSSSNTRMEIKRDESQNFKRKNTAADDALQEGIAWEDTTEVTVLALKAFLQTLLYGDEKPHMPTPQQPPMAPTGKAARAASLYQSTARAVQDPNIEASAPPPPVDLAEGDRPTLDSSFGDAEKQQIQTYIQELNKLSGLGIDVLIIQRNLTFLEAIGEAIQEARARKYSDV